MEKARRINVYVCPKCKGETITINAVDGLTPFLIKCRSVGGCHEEMAQSSFYRVDQNLIPTYEWYRPDQAELAGLDEGVRDHVQRGGLILRRIDGAMREKYGYRTRRG